VEGRKGGRKDGGEGGREGGRGEERKGIRNGWVLQIEDGAAEGGAVEGGGVEVVRCCASKLLCKMELPVSPTRVRTVQLNTRARNLLCFEIMSVPDCSRDCS
jgi:hypothetical protein